MNDKVKVHKETMGEKGVYFIFNRETLKPFTGVKKAGYDQKKGAVWARSMKKLTKDKFGIAKVTDGLEVEVVD